MPRIAVTARHSSASSVESYLPESARIVEVHHGISGADMTIIEAVDSHQGQYIADRLSSGLMGSKVHPDVESAQAYIDSWK